MVTALWGVLAKQSQQRGLSNTSCEGKKISELNSDNDLILFLWISNIEVFQLDKNRPIRNGGFHSFDQSTGMLRPSLISPSPIQNNSSHPPSEVKKNLQRKTSAFPDNFFPFFALCKASPVWQHPEIFLQLSFPCSVHYCPVVTHSWEIPRRTLRCCKASFFVCRSFPFHHSMGVAKASIRGGILCTFFRNGYP